ncbi:UNVERIFIED_CONTAM: 1-aminocyclopropane-1-carboxylate synthase [Sesamum radiatum]|uniref:1-aminocyclopropane-1-carboxylate synthase n=1 Tax=Sesamum radiatum TaxID=300843 RepID=A0AAW2MG09_SESRA
MTMNQVQLLSKIATNDGHGENSAFFDGWKAYDSNPYHPTRNPSGVIQMGLAENQLSFDLVQEWVRNNPKASICTAEGSNDFKDIAIYQDYHGLPEFRNSSNDFKITRRALETAYKKAQESNIKVKGLLLNNPSNPLGTVIDRETLTDSLLFTNEKNIHLICDEIYSATVFSKPGFTSIAEIVQENTDCNRNLIHIVYSLSKDLGFPGFRVGIVYSYNDIVVNCARKMSSFGLVSTQTQHLIASMLSDDVFVDRFIAESSKRLETRHGILSAGLAQVGIGSLKSNAGLYCWMDLRRLLKEPTFEAELELWRVIINDVKLNVSPGASFHCSEPGWFRVCFANMDGETVMVALNRIHKFVTQKKGSDQGSGRKQCRSGKLEISLSFRRLDEMKMAVPHKMSPHSPMSSPLVRART